MDLNFVLTGVGGQGILLAADLVALTGLALGLDVKTAEVHGVAQRGGSVTSQVRWGRHVYSPLIPPGEVDVLLAFERLEALRCLHMLRPDGMVLCSNYRLPPLSVTAGRERYPTPEQEHEAYVGIDHHMLPVLQMAQELGDARMTNVILLGALSVLLAIPEAVWQGAMHTRLAASLLPLNRRAFAAGQTYVIGSGLATNEEKVLAHSAQR